MTKTAAQQKVLYALRIDPDLLAAARKVQDQTGTPVTWQIETALRGWLSGRGALKRSAKTKPPKVATSRKRASKQGRR